MTRDDNRNWDSVFALVERDARITLNEETRKRIIEAYRLYFDLRGGPRLSSKQTARAIASIERLATRLSILQDRSTGILLNALVEEIGSRGRAKRGRPPDEAVDGPLAELKRCYEAAGGRVTFRKNDEGQRVAGPYPDFLRAIRHHVFQRKVLASDEAFIARARQPYLLMRREIKKRVSVLTRRGSTPWTLFMERHLRCPWRLGSQDKQLWAILRGS
jgi:hypothetical protein